MELTLVDGRPAVAIKGAAGTATYLFQVLPPPAPGGWRVRLAVATEPARDYVVTLRPGGHACSCPDFQYRPARRLEGCKHIQAGRVLRQLLSALQGETG